MKPTQGTSQYNPIYKPKESKNRKDESSQREEKNISLEFIIPQKPVFIDGKRVDNVELVEVGYAETTDDSAFKNKPQESEEGFVPATPSDLHSPRRAKFISEKSTMPPFGKNVSPATQRINILQTLIPNKGLPPRIPPLFFSSDTGIDNVPFPTTAPPPTENVSGTDEFLTSPRFDFKTPRKVPSERKPARTTVRKSFAPSRLHSQDQGIASSPRVIDSDPTATEIASTKPQDYAQFPKDTDEFVPRNEEFFEESPQAPSKIGSGSALKDPQMVASSRGPKKQLYQRQSVTPSKIVAPANNWRMADTVGRLIRDYKGDRPESSRVLNILLCAAGGQTEFCAPTMYPETDLCAANLTALPEKNREDYLVALYNELKEYLSPDQQKVISSHLEKIRRGREGTNLRNLLMNLRSDLKAEIGI